MSDITLTLTVPQAFQVQEALDYKLAALYAREERIGRYGGAVDAVARRNLEAAKAALIERLYPSLPEQEGVRTDYEFQERPCPACGAALKPSETHWSLFPEPMGGYVCPPEQSDPLSAAKAEAFR